VSVVTIDTISQRDSAKSSNHKFPSHIQRGFTLDYKVNWLTRDERGRRRKASGEMHKRLAVNTHLLRGSWNWVTRGAVDLYVLGHCYSKWAYDLSTHQTVLSALSVCTFLKRLLEFRYIKLSSEPLFLRFLSSIAKVLPSTACLTC